MSVCDYCHQDDLGGLHTADYCVEVLAEVIRREPVTGGMILPRRPVDHDAHRQGRCVDCGAQPHSAGRPRCEGCHAAAEAALPSMAPQLARGKLASCARSGCARPIVPGRVLCAACTRARQK